MVHREHTMEMRQLLIDAATKRLWSTDESELRIADICADTELSSSVIYTNFRSRQGLIDAAFLDMYANLAGNYRVLLRRYVEPATSASSLIETLSEVQTSGEVNGALAENRKIRLRIATASLARADLRREWIKIQEDHLTLFAEIIEDLQHRGVLGRKLTGRQVAVLLEGFSFGRALDDISLNPESDAAWLKVLFMILEAL